MLRPAVLDNFVDGLPLTVLLFVLALAAVGVLVAVTMNRLSLHVAFVLVADRDVVVQESAAEVGL